jgi:hypothetical protein
VRIAVPARYVDTGQWIASDQGSLVALR